ncbi:hypothetical protein GCM10022393_01900 [Aquimarina addita]|uniref:Uncharacterized protein n=2 Tax=Aquimarina addita TaxID=870485 RepID=A0ABP7X8G2_9FLAO
MVLEDNSSEKSNSENCITIDILDQKFVSDITDINFATFYTDYLLHIYCIKLTQNLDHSSSSIKQKEKILQKFGSDFFERSKNEAKKIYTMDVTENYGELDPKLLEIYKERRKN